MTKRSSQSAAVTRTRANTPFQLGTAIYTYLWALPLDDAVRRCVDFGFRLLELPTTPPFLWPNHFDAYQRIELRRLLADCGARIVSLNPTFLDLNLISLNPGIRKTSIEEAKENVRLAADLEAELVVLAPGRRHGLIPSPLEQAEEVAVDVIGECADFAAHYGVKIGIENIPSTLAPRGADVTRLIERIGRPNCGVVFDVANAQMIEEPVEGLAAVGEHLMLAHYSDTRRDRWAHDALGDGEVDFSTATEKLREIAYTGPIMLETTCPDTPDRSLRESLAVMKELGVSP